MAWLGQRPQLKKSGPISSGWNASETQLTDRDTLDDRRTSTEVLLPAAVCAKPSDNGAGAWRSVKNVAFVNDAFHNSLDVMKQRQPQSASLIKLPFSQAFMDFFKPPIVLIHGLWMTPLSWEYWIPFFEKRGFEVHAPGWPGVDGRTHEEIRENPKPLSLHRIEDIVDHYETYIKKLSEPPIIIGHSFGGLFAQILLSRGLGVVGVAVCPAQPAGIIYISPSTIRTAMPIFTHPLHSDATTPISESHFHYCFGNLVTAEESKKLWERYCIPADSRVLWQLATNVTAGEAAPHYVEFDKPDRAPLLLIGASKDHILTARTVRKEFNAYKGPAPVKYKQFEGMSHGLIFQEGWETVASYVLEYINKHIHR